MPVSHPPRHHSNRGPSASQGGFILCPCHPGAEAALAGRQAEVLPAFLRTAWRRGLATFRIGPETFDPPDDFWPDLVFAHTVVRSLGQVTGPTVSDLAAKAADTVAGCTWDAVHVWRRDERVDAPVADIRLAVAAACGVAVGTDQVTRSGDLVLDCVLDSPDRWWIGWHRAGTPASRWPGGVYPRGVPEAAVSRAWLKLDEAIASFGVTLEPGQRALELGAAPGGACQRLLEAGLHVVGVDAAAVDASVLADARFEQWRMRAREVPLRRFRGFDWLPADMNIDPTSTMAALGRLLEAGTCLPRGVIATLKLPEWSRGSELPGWLDAFRAWGYEPRARQLSTGGRELCVVALSAARRRPSPVRRATRSPGA